MPPEKTSELNENKKVRCPRCRELCDWKDNPYKPFCSEACKTQDLGNWAMEKYRIAGAETDEVQRGDPRKGNGDPSEE